jgi:hypothetical protein
MGTVVVECIAVVVGDTARFDLGGGRMVGVGVALQRLLMVLDQTSGFGWVSKAVSMFYSMY